VTESTTILAVNSSSRELPPRRLINQPFPSFLTHFRGRYLTINLGKLPVSTYTKTAILHVFRSCFNVEPDHYWEEAMPGLSQIIVKCYRLKPLTD